MKLMYGLAALLGLMATVLVAPAQAQETHVIEMLNKHPDYGRRRNVFHPQLVTVKPGDKVLFKSVERGHNAETIKGMIPEGAERFRGRLSKDYEVTFEKPGVYGIKCTPHYALGMVAVVVVEGEGIEASLEQAKSVKHRGKARRVFEEILAEVKIPAAS